MNATDSFKVVGTSCVADFIGNQTAENVAAYFEILAQISTLSDFDDEGMGGGRADHFGVDHFLGFVAADIRVGGWLSRTAARNLDRIGSATADQAWLTMEAVAEGKDVKPELKPTPADWERAQKAIEYIQVHIDSELEKGEVNDYLHNIQVITRMSALAWKASGIAASIIPTAERLMGQEVERRKFTNLKETSKFFGSVGEKVTFKATIISLKELESQWGLTTLVKFVTTEGNVGVWFASGTLGEDWDTDETVILRGSVKKHENYQGLKQTNLTRVSMMTQTQLDEEAAKAQKKAERAAKKAAKAATVA
jgi:hypothetical protein